MEPTRSYEPTILANDEHFGDPFFQRFVLRYAPKPLKLDDRVCKNYRFPTFYADVTCSVSIFLCDYKAAAALMPDLRMRPVRMTRGRSLVAFSSYIYRNVMGLPPYNEIAMTIPVLVDSLFRPPVLPMVIGMFAGFGFYVFAMPVTSLENKIRGNKIWGLPKTLSRIDIVEAGDECVTAAYEEGDHGRPYLTFRTPMFGKPTQFDVRGNLYSTLDGRLLRSQMNFCGTFNVTKHMDQLLKKGVTSNRKYLEIGEGRSAEMLRCLGIEACPFQCRFARTMNACFDLPDPEFK
jgi:hypothetical protein